jgi:chromatin segregation and condensation protein Rec8/ScpA/Scc1 (kleisin family)
VLSALLALLELARSGELRLSQVRPFASVEIAREPTSEAA